MTDKTQQQLRCRVCVKGEPCEGRDGECSSLCAAVRRERAAALKAA